ncbi:MAG: hypothetical protein ACREFI_19985 [Stellaceae bacterium]
MSKPYLAAVVALLSYAPAALAQNAASPQPVTITGCPVAGVEGNCLAITSKGTTYNITSANPKPDPSKHLMISLRGTPDPDKVSICMQGTILKDIKWEYLKQTCPAP